MNLLERRILEMAKPKVIPPPNHTEIGEDIRKKVYDAHKGLPRGESYHYYNSETGDHTLVMEHGGGSKYTTQEVLEAHPRVKIVSCNHHDGSYDWASDTYNKDSTVAVFRLK